MKTVKKSKLIVQSSKYNFNDELQKTIDDYNKEGLIVRIENSFSNSSHVGGSAIFLHNPYVLWGLLVILAMTITIGEYGE
jgi:hypothetical protein